MAGRGVLSKGGLFSVRKVLLTILFALALTVGANGNQQGILPIYGGYRDDIRGVVVMFARDHQLPLVLYTITQFQQAHNYGHSEERQFSRDWVFYSDEDVSDEFKLLTSNLTLPGTAYYELWACHDLVYNGWNLPALSQHGRLREYNWAWSVAPGTEFHADINFDVFEAMKSEGMVYGSSTSGPLPVIRPSSANNGDSDSTEQEPPNGVREVRWNVGEHPDSSESDGSIIVLDGQRSGSLFNSISPANRTASWMDLVYDVCNSCWDFEVGWLDFFRNIDYTKIANYITSSLDMVTAIDALSTWYTSPTFFGAKSKSGPGSCNALIGYPDSPASSVGPRSGVFYLLGNPEDEMSAVHERWMQMANDFEEQKKTPGLRAGRTSLYWRATVYVHKGKRARAWLWKEGIEFSVAKPSGNKYFDTEIFFDGDGDDTSDKGSDLPLDEDGDLLDADDSLLDADNNLFDTDDDLLGEDDDLLGEDDDLLGKDDGLPLEEGDE